jgi:hypothetical protein
LRFQNHSHIVVILRFPVSVDIKMLSLLLLLLYIILKFKKNAEYF